MNRDVPERVRSRPGSRYLLLLSAAVLAAASFVQSGSSHALWTTSLTINPGTLTAGSISAGLELAPSSITFTQERPSAVLTATFFNTGTVAADYSATFDMSGDPALLTHLTALVWLSEASGTCSPTPPADATPITAVPTGQLQAGTPTQHCVAFQLDPTGIAPTATATLHVRLALTRGGWSSAAGSPLQLTYRSDG